jgi:hypothetical protein
MNITNNNLSPQITERKKDHDINTHENPGPGL